jgi:2-methylcitrate dehydratase PrpD
MGFGYHQASGSAQSMRDGVLSKRLGAGFAARNAVTAAALAVDGLTGTRRTLEGNAGLFALYERGEVNTDALTRDLGVSWRIPEYSIKPYPCCRCNHTAIGLGVRLHREGIRAEAVERIEIRMGEVNWLTVGEPYDVSRNSVVHAQFNAAYSFARALHDGRVNLQTYTKPAIVDPAIAALARLTQVVSDPSVESNAIEPARVKLTLKSGRIAEVSSDTIKGSPQEPMTPEELRAKFTGCLQFGLDARPDDIRNLADTVAELERVADVGSAIVEAFPV